MITPGYSIVRAAGASPVIASVGGVDGHVATGLTRPDVFNWFTHLSAEVKTLRPKVVVLNFGANDDHNYMTGLPQGTSIGSFASPEWTAEYRRRVAGVMDTVNRAGAVVVWIGLPITRSESQTQRFDTINAIVQKEAKARPGKAIFIDTYTMFAGDDGGFAEYLQNAKGDTVKVRAGDGVHFDTAGGDLIAREVLKQLNQPLRPDELAAREGVVTRLRGVPARRQRRGQEPAADGGVARGADGARFRERFDDAAERQRPPLLRGLGGRRRGVRR